MCLRVTQCDKGDQARGREGVGAGFALKCHFALSHSGSVALPVPVSVGAFRVRWGVQAVGQVLVAVTGTVGPVGS